MVTVALFNESTVLADAQIEAVLPALQTQVSRDFAPVWGRDAKLVFVGKGGAVDPSHWQLAILDDADQAGALGYHDMTPNGMPFGKVFAKTDLQYGSSWTVTVSHELLEMLADPWVFFSVVVDLKRKQGKEYPIEVCDACEDDSLGYSIAGVLLSDFVTPHWFDAALAGQKLPFDFCGHITAPFQLLPGGYIGVRQIGEGHGWTQITARLAEVPGGEPDDGPVAHREKNAAPLGSRREKRRSHGELKKSTEASPVMHMSRNIIHVVQDDLNAFIGGLNEAKSLLAAAGGPT